MDVILQCKLGEVLVSCFETYHCNVKAKFSFQIRIHIFKFSIYINSVSIETFKGKTSRHLYITAVLYTTYYNNPGIKRTKINLLVLSMYDLYSCSVEILYLNLLYTTTITTEFYEKRCLIIVKELIL